MKIRKAIYAGSFDPLTNGHRWVIERAANLFDELTIAIGVNPDKKYLLTAEERHQNIVDTLKEIGPIECKVGVEVIENKFLAKYAAEKGVSCLVRGVRSESDFSYEYAMAVVNRKIDPTIDSIYLMPPPQLAQVSSSLVKTMIGPQDWKDLVVNYVPAPVFTTLQSKFT